ANVGAGRFDVLEVEEEDLDVAPAGHERGAGTRTMEDLIDAHRREAALRERPRRAVVDVAPVVAARTVRVKDDRISAARHRALRGGWTREREARIEGIDDLRRAPFVVGERTAVARFGERELARLKVRGGPVDADVLLIVGRAAPSRPRARVHHGRAHA